MKTILQLITFPSKQAVHGGQRRAHALKKAYQKAGFKVVTCSIFNPLYYAASERGAFDVEPSQHTLDMIKKQPILEDIILGEACFNDEQINKHIVKLLEKLQPKFIVFEHPYMYLGVKEILKNDRFAKVGIINSTHNVEYEMKDEIYNSHKELIDADLAKKSVAKIKKTEEELAKHAQLTLVVSESDARTNRELGAKSLLVVPNGINQYKVDTKVLEKWQKRLATDDITSPILFTGSAHGPNATGFEVMVGYRPGFLPINSKIYIVGGVGNVLQDRINNNDSFYGRLLWERAIKCGQLSDKDLAALIKLSTTIILPITEGGGSNLKTAEAIISGKNVVATKHAMRGYEEFIGDERVTVADNPLEFKKALVKSLVKKPEYTDEDKMRASTVLWSQRTKLLTEYMEKIND